MAKHVLLDCGHEFDADKVPYRNRKKVECPGGCGWRKFEVVTHETKREGEDARRGPNA